MTEDILIPACRKTLTKIGNNNAKTSTHQSAEVILFKYQVPLITRK